MHFLKGNGLLNFASRGDLRLHRGRRGKFDSRMMHGSRVYHPKFAPFAPRIDSTLHPPMHTSNRHCRRCHHYQRIFDSRPRYSSTFSFSFCPKAFRSSPRTPPLRSRTSATRIYGPSSATSSLKASSLSLLSSSSLPQGILLLRIKALYAQKKGEQNLHVQVITVNPTLSSPY